VIYLDTSALLKLVVPETHSDALRAWLQQQTDQYVSSVLLTIETRRALQREAPTQLPRADLLLTRVGQVGLTHAVVEAASRLPSPDLRSLGAIHLATALLLREEVTSFVSYDKRLLAAAQAERLPVVSPD